jgi:hypothetical protein
MYSIAPRKSAAIQIPQQTPKYNIEAEYSLKQNLFDPTKSSPPNEFMNKLRSRMSLHGSLQNKTIVGIK